MSNNKAFKVKNGLELADYNKSISDTAVDIFVYDTRKDSDGGAWRKRTQHTSWYNETLNTSTRGSRKEFPAVAVIVAESNQVTIYDGDDPDLPMWMVFNAAAQGTLTWTSTPTSLYMLNANLYIGTNGRVVDTNFITDRNTIYSNAQYLYLANISQRNSVPSSTPTIGTGIVNSVCNDVAMTVLPNAPIDAATGLPVPTIAVATDGGVSVIKDDGTVVDIKVTSAMTGSTSVYFLPDNRIAFNAQQSSVSPNYYRYCIAPIPSSDVSNQAYWQSYADDVVKDYAYSDYTGEIPLFPNTGLGANITTVEKVGKDHAIGGLQSLSLLAESSLDNSSKDLFAYITSDYNTGWMNGDIKLATLSDTDDTDVVGSGNLITDPSSFSDSNGLITETSGVISASGADTYIHTGVTTVLGQRYYAEVNHTAGSTCTFSVTDAPETTTIVSQSSLTGAGVVKLYFTGNGSTVKLRFSNNSTFTIQDIGIYAVELDRSVNNNGLIVNGTVTKNPVATGADLVAYSGFNASNYLQQPYNSAMDIDATDDVCVIAWAKLGTANSYIFDRTDDANAGARYFAYRRGGSDDKLVFMGLQSSTAFDDTFVAGWHQYTLLRRSGTIEIWVDGKLDATGADTQDRTNTSAKLTIGNNYTQGAFNGASALALFRFSATAPSPEQIARIYNDEKHLFTEGAQATLYGSSDSVTALAFDDTTNLLHVGTSAGRSVFQGLRRVDNTTTAVTSAISASNGLVADE